MHRVAITGMSLISPLGRGVGENWRRMLEGGFRFVRGQNGFAGFVEGEMEEECAKEALGEGGEFGVVYCAGMAQVGDGRLDVGNVDLFDKLKVDGPVFTVCNGLQSGAAGIFQAVGKVQRGDVQRMLVIGRSGRLTEQLISAYDKLGYLDKNSNQADFAAIPYESNSSGLVLSEGCAALVLENYESAQSRGAQIYSLITGAGSYQEAKYLTKHTETAEGFIEATLEAMAGGQIQGVVADGAGIREKDRTEVVGLLLLKNKPIVTAPQSWYGFMGSASGIANAVIANQILNEGVVPAIRGLKNPITIDRRTLNWATQNTNSKISKILCSSLSFGGNSHCFVFSKP